MAYPNWDEGFEIEVLAKAERGFWTKVLDYVDASIRLKFVVAKDRPIPRPVAAPAANPPVTNAPAIPQMESNRWTHTPLSAALRFCTGDGDPRAPINPVNCLLPDAPPCALIGKVGGSIAGKADGTKPFVVGTFCVFDLDEKTKGPVYLTMNADPMSPLERDGHIVVKIYRSS